MCANFSGGGAVINVLTRACGAKVRVVDVGVAADVAGLEGIEHRKIRAGTDDLSRGPAMTPSEVTEALGAGLEVVGDVDARLVGVGEMGIANTTAAAAVAACLTEAAAGDVVGRGTGVDEDGLARKREVLERAVARVGGLEAGRDDALGLVPLLDLEMRLGEGTGSPLAIPVVRAAASLLREMATFESAGISGPSDDPSGAAP